MKPSYRELQVLCKQHNLTVKCNKPAIILTQALIKAKVLTPSGLLPIDDTSTDESDDDAEVYVCHSDSYEESRYLPLRGVSEYGDKGSVLGKGTYSTVYKFSEYAIKFNSDRNWDITSPYDVLIEIAVMKRLQHPNITQIIDVVTARFNGFLSYGIVMPLATSTVRESSIGASIADIDRMVYQMMCGVAYMHARNIVHGDIKPSNVLYYGPNDVRLADFGLCKLFGGGISPKWEGDVYTIWYRPPELLDHATKNNTYGMPSDIWACMVTAWELYTHKPLFPGSGSELDQMKLVSKVLADPTAILKELPEQASGVRDIIRRSFVLDQHARPTAYEIMKDPYFDPYRTEKNEQGCEMMTLIESNMTRDRCVTEGLNKPDLFNMIANLCFRAGYHIRTYLAAAALVDQVLVGRYARYAGDAIIAPACLSIVADITEPVTISIKDYLDVTKSQFAKLDFNNSRHSVLGLINYDLIFTVPSDYNHYSEMNSMGLTTQYQRSLVNALLVFVPFSAVRFWMLPYEIHLLVCAMTLTYYGLDVTSEQQRLLDKYGSRFISDIGDAKDNEYAIALFEVLSCMRSFGEILILLQDLL